MENYKIINASYGIGNGGMSCGPVSGNVFVSVKFKKENEDKIQYLTAIDVEGLACEFYLSDESVFDYLFDEGKNEEFLENFFEKNKINKIGNMQISDDNDELIEVLEKSNDFDHKFIKYIFCLLMMNIADTNELIKKSIGKSIDEIELPDISGFY